MPVCTQPTSSGAAPLAARPRTWLIYGELLEDHVVASFCAALQRRGHKVIRLPSLYRNRFMRVAGNRVSIISRDNLAEVTSHIVKNIVQYDADVFFTFRYYEVPQVALNVLRDMGVTTITWFSDDPLLYNLTGELSNDYAITLHTGNADVLQFYERDGSPDVMRYCFPFWTDSVQFPYVFNAEGAQFDLGFLGNIYKNKRKGKRYTDFASLTGKKAIWGNVYDDPYKLCQGYLNDFSQIPQAIGKIKIGINFSQDFTDLDETDAPYYFEGVRNFIEFYIPSRIIEYLACGIPCINISRIDPRIDNIFHAYDIEGANELIEAFLADNFILNRISAKSHASFLRYFTADQRVQTLENILDIRQPLPLKLRSRLWKNEDADIMALARIMAQNENSGQNLSLN